MQRRQYGADDDGANPLGSLKITTTRHKKGQRKTTTAVSILLVGLPLLLAAAVLFLSGIFLVPTALQQNKPVSILQPPPNRVKTHTDKSSTVLQGQIIVNNHSTANKSTTEYHIVFSTGCSAWQDWQSYVFFFQALQVGQPGTITRIVSGCDEETTTTVQRLFQEQIQPMAPERFKIHFTPDYAHVKKGVNYPYFNKRT